MKTDVVKGFRDIGDARKRIAIEGLISEVFERYGFRAAETPIIEYEEFVRGENGGDEAVSDIFKLKDKGKRNLALRYEFTFQLKRLAKNKKLPFKRYQIGPVFRDEPVGGSRWRQFVQCDVDTIGSDARDEAEILKVVSELMQKLGIDSVIYLNNRKLLNEILEEQGVKSKDRELVIREIDKLDKIPEADVKKNLKKYKAESLLNVFKKPAKYFERYGSYKEIKEVLKWCGVYGVEVKFQPTIARGLSYYTGTIFEIKTEKMKESIAAGGSYLIDGITATGVSLGLDRLELISKLEDEEKDILIISLDQDKAAIKLAQQLRGEGISTRIFYGKPSKALDYANSYAIPSVIFVGADEVKKKKYKLKDMNTGTEKVLGPKGLVKSLRH